ncbi:hypothetical protein LAZ40_09380 [Cereibacter sphaeroides]|uniref:hypothetical protein n=3 Tax=Cereibacter sphaeroides TaxID=1063 RepID=UPI001F3B6250|nr:hypothetical protein [Cereibacter sphaeroides]MCE6959263.1 hypothetical protein [Cereibacter sphaeroides]
MDLFTAYARTLLEMSGEPPDRSYTADELTAIILRKPPMLFMTVACDVDWKRFPLVPGQVSLEEWVVGTFVKPLSSGEPIDQHLPILVPRENITGLRGWEEWITMSSWFLDQHDLHPVLRFRNAPFQHPDGPVVYPAEILMLFERGYIPGAC